jgi:AbrB family looped-hinge helix DNA binding protein
MTTETSRLTRKYQATIPAGVRRSLGLHAGDVVVFEPRDNGEVVVRKATAVDRAFAAAVSETLTEWASPADEAAFRDL